MKAPIPNETPSALNSRIKGVIYDRMVNDVSADTTDWAIYGPLSDELLGEF